MQFSIEFKSSSSCDNFDKKFGRHILHHHLFSAAFFGSASKMWMHSTTWCHHLGSNQCLFLPLASMFILLRVEPHTSFSRFAFSNFSWAYLSHICLFRFCLSHIIIAYIFSHFAMHYGYYFRNTLPSRLWWCYGWCGGGGGGHYYTISKYTKHPPYIPILVLLRSHQGE